VILALTAALAIVVQDHAALRAAPRSNAVELATLWQGDVLEVRGERAGYLKVYNYRREQGGYLSADAARPVLLTESAAPELLAVVRFLRQSAGLEPLGISYGAAYLRAIPPQSLTAEPLDAIAGMAERLADEASAGTVVRRGIAAQLEVIEQFGVHMRAFERNGQTKLCYDGELYRQILTLARASAEERAHAALGLTRADCIDPSLGPLPRASLDDERASILDVVADRDLSAITRSRLHARRAAVWATIAFEQARSLKPCAEAAQRAMTELLYVHPEDLGDDRRAEFVDAVMRVGAVRWAASIVTPQTERLGLTATPGDPGQTCVTLAARTRSSGAPLVRRCTYGVVWIASAQSIAQGEALVLAVQPVESWRELWVFHQSGSSWRIDILSPGITDPEEGYVEFAGFVPHTRRLLIAREVKIGAGFRRRFEELRLDDLALVREASTPLLLPDFGRWQDAAWRRETLALR
jgi:hypothetical protein